ncbi:Lethal(2) giant larvae sro7 [Linderina pennispora]|nr:Lethal(2) giant larvae sro7 [Linderina pennispora]
MNSRKKHRYSIFSDKDLRVVKDRYIDPRVDATAVTSEPTQKLLAVGYSNGSIKLFSPKYPSASRLQTKRTDGIQFLCFVPNTPALAAIDTQGVLWAFDTDTLSVCYAYKLPSLPTAMSVLQGTGWLMVGSENGRVYFVDLVNGKKSDYSIACYALSPNVPVASVESHPLDSDRILVAYADGGCIVWELRGFEASEKESIKEGFVFDHPSSLKRSVRVPSGVMEPGLSAMPRVGSVQLVEPRLTGASWAPSGSQFAAVYDNGVVCVFTIGDGPQPAVARTIEHTDVLAGQISNRDISAPLRCLGNVRWCTHANLDQSFLVVCSGSSVTFKQLVHILATGDQAGHVKSGRDVRPLERYELDSSMMALAPLPLRSPWRSGNDGVHGLAITIGRPSAVRVLTVDSALRVARSTRLPGELSWCSTPATVARSAKGTLNLSLFDALPNTIGDGLFGPDGGASERGLSPGDMTNGLSQLLCCADTSGHVSLWCSYSHDLERCVGVCMNYKYVARLLGIEGEITSMDLYASSGMLAVGTGSGETLLCVITEDPRIVLSKKQTPLEELRELSLVYYLDAQVMIDQAMKASIQEEDEEELQLATDETVSPSETVSKPSDASEGSVKEKDGVCKEQDEALDEQDKAQEPDGGTQELIDIPLSPASSKHSSTTSSRRSSRRSSLLNSATGLGSRMTLHVRQRSGSLHEGRLTRRLSKFVGRHTSLPGELPEEDKLAGIVAAGLGAVDESQELGSGLAAAMGMPSRPMVIDSAVWAARRTRINTEMSEMVHGLRFSAIEREMVSDIGLPNKPTRANMPNSPVGPDDSPMSPGLEQQTPVILPFMLARFHKQRIIDVIAGYDGVVAVIYEGGIVVVVDCVNQAVLLADNLNLEPQADQNVRDIFGMANLGKKAAKIAEHITAANIVRLPVRASGSKEAAGSSGAGSDDHLIIGTSRGNVSLYSIYGTLPPQAKQWAGSGEIIYLEVASLEPSVLEEDPELPPHLLIVATRKQITSHAGFTSLPLATHSAPVGSQFVKVRAVKLHTGWHGLVAIDSHGNASLLSIHNLSCDATHAIPGAKEMIGSCSIQINSHGHISLLGPHALLLQASVVDGFSVGAGFDDSTGRSMFDQTAKAPERPVRPASLASWFGSMVATPKTPEEVSGMLDSHHRDLLRMGGTQPGARLHKPPAALGRTSTVHSASGRPAGNHKGLGRSATIHGATDTAGFSQTRNMMEKRGQMLEDLGQKMERNAQQSASFLQEIKAYNARQEASKKKRFGLF